MPRRMSPAEYQAKQAKNLKASTTEITAGVNAVSEAPSAKAVAKQDKMLANLTESVQNGTWGRRLSAVTLADYKNDMIKKGIPRIAVGIDNAAPKVQRFAAALLPVAYASSDEIAGMADMTKEDSKARMLKNFDNMAAFKYKTTG